MSIQRYILTILLLTISTLVSAKKMLLPIESVAIQADIIVTGEIIKVNSDTYELRISDQIKGTNDAIITVQQFREWTCDIRYAKVERGQKLFLFLKRIENKLEIINGSTGEIPIINGRVILKDEEYIHKDYQFNPYKLDLAEFSAGVKGFIKCFRIVTDCNGCYPRTFMQKCSDNELSEFIAMNKFSEWIYKKVKAGYSIVKA